MSERICKHEEFSLLVLGPLLECATCHRFYDCDWDEYVRSGKVTKMRPATDAAIERYKATAAGAPDG